MADFEYVRSPTGELSGESLVAQTEQALSVVEAKVIASAQSAADAATSARVAEQQATAAATSATEAASRAQSAEQKADTAVSTANQADAKSDTALSTAQTAVTTAGNAVTAAEAAQTAAEDAADDAEDSRIAAEDAADSAADAQTAAEAAQTIAEGAATTAGQANTNANTAVNTANQAAQTASDAVSTASQLANPNRYSAKYTASTLTVGATVNISDLDDSNVAIGNAVLDAVGNLFKIASIDTVNGTVTLEDADAQATPPVPGMWSNPSVLFAAAQTLSSAEQAQARANVGAAEDAAVVHLSGDETIAGTKTFSSTVVGSTVALARSSTGSHLRVSGGTGNFATGGYLDLFGATNTSTGTFYLGAHDGTNEKRMVGQSDGSLTWDGNEVLTTANGVDLASAQTITGAKTFSITITTESQYLAKRSGTTSQLVILGGNGTSSGARVAVRGNNYSADPGSFLLQTGANLHALEGKDDGSLTWNSNEVLTATRNAQVGTATITAGTTSVSVTFATPFASAPIVTVSADSFKPIKVSAVSTTGATFDIETADAADIVVSYIAVSI